MEDNKIDNTSIDEEFYDEDRYEDDFAEFEEHYEDIEGVSGIEDISSSNELCKVNKITMMWFWNGFAATPKDIKKYILEDMANISIFKGGITPEVFDSEVKEHLEELDEELCENVHRRNYQICYKDRPEVSEDDIERKVKFATEKKYVSIDDFKYDPHELFSTDIVPCGGVITGKNRYIYCFYDSVDEFFFGKEFFVDKKGKIHEGTKNWMVIQWFKFFGYPDFWDIAYEFDKNGMTEKYQCYVPGLIVLYSMAKYVTKKRKR